MRLGEDFPHPLHFSCYYSDRHFILVSTQTHLSRILYNMVSRVGQRPFCVRFPFPSHIRRSPPLLPSNFGHHCFFILFLTSSSYSSSTSASRCQHRRVHPGRHCLGPSAIASSLLFPESQISRHSAFPGPTSRKASTKVFCSPSSDLEQNISTSRAARHSSSIPNHPLSKLALV